MNFKNIFTIGILSSSLLTFSYGNISKKNIRDIGEISTDNVLLTSKQKVNDILKLGDLELQKSIDLVGKKEIDIFNYFFDINSSDKFIFKVKEIQKKYGLKVDGIIGIKTLEKLYKNFYIPNKNFFFNEEILEHIKAREKDYELIDGIKKEMKLYPYKISKNGIKPNSKGFLKNIDKKIYGDKLSLNKPGTFINKDLCGKIPLFLEKSKNLIIIENFNGKKIMRVYINGELKIATYVSPGRKNKKTPIYDNVKLPGFIDKYHATGLSKPRGAVMPYAILIDGIKGIYLHGTGGIVDGKIRSLGCIRVPLFYQKKLFDLVEKGLFLKIDTKNIYKN